MMKKIMVSGFLLSSVLLVGCNREPEVVVLADSGNENSDTELSSESSFFSKLQTEIITSITEQTKLDRDSLAIMMGGNDEEMTVSVSYPKNVKVDEIGLQQIVEDSIKKVSRTENVTINEDNLKVKIEKY